MSGLRDHGLGDINRPAGPPVWEPAGEDAPPCPNCGGKVCAVTVEVSNALLMGSKGLCRYFGCPACPWASPAVTTTEVLSEDAGDRGPPRPGA